MKDASATTVATAFKSGDRVIWLGCDRRDGAIGKYTEGTVIAAYKEGLTIAWHLTSGDISDIISFGSMGYLMTSMLLLTEYSDYAQDLTNFSDVTLPLLLASFYPVKQQANRFKPMGLIAALDRFHPKKRRH